MSKRNLELVQEWTKGWNSGADAVLEFLKDIKEIDLVEEFHNWAKCDEYTKKNGEVVKRYE